MSTLPVPDRVVVAEQRAPIVERLLPRGSLRRVGPAVEVRERGVVGCDEPGLGAGLDRHVAHRHPALHRERPDRRPAVLDHVADAAAGADLTDDREDQVLGGHARREVAVDVDGHPLRASLRQRLRGQHVLDLARTDAERERTEGAVRGRVAVTAHDRHARLRPPLLGTDDVDDALPGVAHRIVGDAELGGVAAQGVDLLGRDLVGDRLVDVLGRDVVVLGRDRQLGTAYRAPAQPEPVEGLRAGDLVNEMQVDVEQIGFTRCGSDEVTIPDLLGKRCSHCASHILR